MSKRCCEWHNHLPEDWSADTEPTFEFGECGHAGMGTPSVCCRNCPQFKYFVERRGFAADQIDIIKDIMAMPVGQRP